MIGTRGQRLGRGNQRVQCLQALRLLIGHRGHGLLRIALGGHRGLPFDHLSRALRRLLYQIGNGRRLRKVAPVFPRHVLAHRRGIDAGGIEHVLVICLPRRLEGVALRRIGLSGRRPFGQHLAVPMARSPRGQDRPDEAAKALHEKCNGGIENEMLGLEPGDIALRAVGIGRFPEAHKGMHLVDVAPHALGHELQAMDQRIARYFEQRALSAQDAPDEVVQQGEAFGVAVADRQPDQFADTPGQGDRRSAGYGRRGIAEEIVIVRRAPQHLIGRCAPCHERADGVAESVEIRTVLDGHADQAHQKRLACSAGGAICGRRFSAPASLAGGE